MKGSFWPELELMEVKAPITILKEQGENLKKATKGILTYKIEKMSLTDSNNRNEMYCSFYVIAPLIDGLEYLLFRIVYPSIDIFPLKLIFNGKGESTKTVQNWDTFESALKQILSSNETKNILEKLLAHSKAAAEV